MLEAFEYLKQRDMADCLQLVHFHLGSQITNIRNIKNALTEAARVYVELHRVGAGVKYLDVGGGLGIDYDGSQTDFESSVNYTLQEYANDVVFRIKSVCDEAGVPHPTIISESGRAVVAYHSVLVFDVLGVSNFDRYQAPPEIPADAPQPIADLFAIHRDLSKKNLPRELPRRRAGGGRGAEPVQPRLPDASSMRALAERLFWAVCSKLLQASSASWTTCPRSCRAWRRCCRTPTSATSRSSSRCPTSWAIKQLFPIMPIHRLNEAPTRRAVLGDITCDSDGKIDQFIDLRDVRNTLELHPFNGQPYYLGAFLLGAYQEILGDLHNLFGDTNAVHVSLDDDGEVEPRRGHQGRHGPRGAALRAVLRRRAGVADAQGRGAGRAGRQDFAGGIAAAAALLRDRAGGVYLPGRAVIEGTAHGHRRRIARRRSR